MWWKACQFCLSVQEAAPGFTDPLNCSFSQPGTLLVGIWTAPKDDELLTVCMLPRSPWLHTFSHVSPGLGLYPPCLVLGPPDLGGEGAMISNQSLCIYRHHTQYISPSTYKITLMPVVKGLLYSLAQNFISAKIPLIVQVICWKISQESELGTRARELMFHLLGCHLLLSDFFRCIHCREGKLSFSPSRFFGKPNT